MSQPPPSAPPYQRPPANGAIAWIVGLVVLVCLPFVGSILAAVLMITLGLAQRGKGALAAHNGIRAANWGLTYLISTVVLVGGHFLALWYLTRDGGTIGGFFPFGIIISLWGVVSLWHVVVCVWGTVVTARNQPFGGNGIPFIRESR